ncbi:MAG TPA: hypothetical protein VNF71_02535 [Acidimicrobiales bacterium]|nr:hypothetical protein [Acidimicrobiales bacterium]
MKLARHSLIRAAVVAVATLGLGTLVAIGTPGTAKSAAATTTSGSPGYWLVASDGGVYGFDAPLYGSMRGQYLNKPVVGMAGTNSGLGYWLVASDGGVFTYGDAGFYGSTGNVRLNQPIVGMAADPATGGYWLVAADGGVFNFGAPFFGSTGNIRLNQPIVGMAATPDGLGYWLVAADGGVFNFGDAQFYGSTGNIRLNQAVVGMAADPAGGGSGGGYWLVAADGGIFNFGDAHYDGSTGAIKLNKPVTGMAATANGGGYWLVATDGGIFTFGNAPYLGSTGSHPGPAPVVGIASTDNGYPFPPGSTGYDISKWQCNNLPPTAPISIVEISGAVNGYQNPCYAQEAAWAGQNISTYIYMDPMQGTPTESQPTACKGDINCEAYHFGNYWAQYWVSTAHSLGVYPNLWWLDVECKTTNPCSADAGVPWPGGTQGQTENTYEIAGAIAGLRSSGVIPGIYSTNYQWSIITGGGYVNAPGISLWMAGGEGISGGTYSAQNICNNAVPASNGWMYSPFAEGRTVLVQYSTGPTYDQDYACT